MKKLINKKNMMKNGMVGVMTLLYSNNVFADDTETSEAGQAVADQILNPIWTIIDIMLAGMAAVGVAIIVKNLWGLSDAVKQQDDSGYSSAFRGLIGGGILAAGGTILALMGIGR